MAGSKPRRGPAGSSARQKSAAFRAAEKARERRRRITQWVAVVIGVLVVVGAVALGVVASSRRHSTASSTSAPGTDTASAVLSGPIGPEGIVLQQAPVLAPLTGAAQGATVDGVQCNSGEQVAYHLHTHLSVYVDGSLRAVPYGVGVVEPVPQQSPNGVFVGASRCYYWLHTHAQDGIIHVEAPSETTYTLGQFFAIWNQPLTSTRVGPATGSVTAYVNGARYTGDPAAIPLRGREDVQFDVGTVVPPRRVDWSQSQL